MTTMTAYEYEVQGNYGQGWECVTTEDTMTAARDQLRDYRENEPQYPHRIKRVRAGEDEGR